MLRNKQSKDYYFPKLLLGQLAQILEYPLTWVEAPSGFGKTTAIKEYLAEACPTTNVYWYTCLGEPPYKAWDSICNIISAVNKTTVEKIKNLGIPCEDTLYDMIELIDAITCTEQTVLVIDNYQLIRNEILDMLSNAFTGGFHHNFHVVIITQPLKKKLSSNTVSSPQKLLIDRSYFFFSKEAISIFFMQSGIRLSANELDHIWRSTEGWVAAVYLQKKNYLVLGSFRDAVGIDGLLETSIWNRLTAEEQSFLLSLSLFNRFTLKQAMIMLGTDELPEYASELLTHNDFIRYDDNSHSYYFHSLLHDYLAKHMEQKKATAYGRLVYLRAGLAYGADGQNYRAAQCYYEIEDFERLLSLPFKCADLDEWVGLGSEIFIANILQKCPREVLLKHPENLIVFAFELFTLSKYALFLKLSDVITQILSKENPNLSESELEWLSGEFALMTSVTKFNDIVLMGEELKKAYCLLGGASKLLTFVDGWTMDAPSVLYLFWRESGALRQELQSIEASMPYYYKVANYHGMGAEIVMQAEALLYRGDDMGAEILCHKALYLAEMKEQKSICFCAEMCLLRIAILRGDTFLFESVMKNLDKRTLTGYAPRSRYVQALIKGFLYIQLGNTEKIEGWLLEPFEAERFLYSAAVSFGQVIYAGYLIACGQYAKLIGISEVFIQRAEGQNLMLAKLYQLLYLSIAYLHTNQREKAAEQLEIALNLALPDEIYLPFAENAHLLGDLLDGVCAADKIHSIALRQRAGVGIMIKCLQGIDPGLTPREKEIARLAQAGKTNKEIGALLFISPETVKMTLKNIFKKLDLHSRVQLETIKLESK